MGPGQVHDLKICPREAKSNGTWTVKTCGSGPLEIRRAQERTGWCQVLFVLCPQKFTLDGCPVVFVQLYLSTFFRAEEGATVV